MQAFHYQFIFRDEPQLTLSVEVENKPNPIYVKENNTLVLGDIFALQSPWVSMTRREVRYYTNTPFEKTTAPFSWALEIKNIITLIWYPNKQEIAYIKGKDYTADLLQFWVLHTFFPLVLELDNRYHILHVSGVKIAEKAVLFSAFSGGGKSTLIDYFIQKGHAVYGDDTVAVKEDNHRYEVMASYPFYRPFRQPEVLGYTIPNFVQTVDTLSAIYLLEKVEGNTEVSIVPLSGIEKFEVLYQSKFVTFETMKKERYLFAVRMAKYVQVFKIYVPWDLERLDEVYQAVVTHNHV
jgi:hypothetical protein